MERTNSTAIILLIALFFGIYCFVFGQSGFLERKMLVHELEYLTGFNEILKTENSRLLNLLDAYKNNPDLSANEAVKSGYLAEGSKAIVFKDDKKNIPSRESGYMKFEKQKKDLFYLRIIYIVIAVILLLFVIIKNRSKINDFHDETIPL